MHRADARAREHAVGSLGHHGHVKTHSVALAHAVRSERVRQPARVAERLAVRDPAHFGRLIALPDDGEPVGWVPIEAVDRNVEHAVGEPRHVAASQAAAHDRLRRCKPA